MKKKSRTVPALLLFAVILFSSVLLLAGCEEKEAPLEDDPTTKIKMPAVIDPSKVVTLSASFADHPGYRYEATPCVPAYTVEPDLANIVNLQQFTTGYAKNDDEGFWKATELSDEAFELIEKNGFAVSDKENWTEYFAIYELNRYNYVPSFITTDSAVHSLFLMFDYILKDIEQQFLYRELVVLSNKMVAASDEQYHALKGTDFENAAKRNVAFFSVGSSLLDPAFPVPNYAQELVGQELALIAAQGGIAVSPIINAGETAMDITEAYMADYSQYITRGHYTLTPELGAYFKAMMWYGQMTFRSQKTDEVKSALLQMTAMLEEERGTHWLKIFEPTNFFVGECDDITWYQYYEAVRDIYGNSIGDLNTITDAALFEQALASIHELEPPQINSVPIFNEEIQPDRDGAITGYRFMGQRFTIDGVILQRLMDRETPRRMLPKALDIPAAFGSHEAYAILEAEGDAARYPAYPANMEKVRSYVAGVDEQVWHSNLYWSWLDMLKPLADETAGAGMPLFMQNDAWTRKELNTFIGSWTELKYSTVLYAKPPMAEFGGGGDPPEPPDDRGYVEPNPEVYGRLSALAQLMMDGLERRGLLSESARGSLGVLKALSDGLTEISVKELANEPLTEAQADFIRLYGGELEHLWETAKKDETQGLEWHFYLGEHPCAVIVDIATDPNGSALQEATGFAKEIFVAFPRDGQVVLGRGVVYSQYEFTVPLEQRMTVEAWHEKILEGDLPQNADWKNAFLVDVDHKAEYFYPRNRIMK